MKIKKKGKCIFIHCRNVFDEGIILLGELLKLIGYKQAIINKKNNTKTKGHRFMYLSSEKSIQKNCSLIDLKKRFNREDNKNGEYIQVIIATDYSRRGIFIQSYSTHNYNVSLVELC